MAKEPYKSADDFMSRMAKENKEDGVKPVDTTTIVEPTNTNVEPVEPVEPIVEPVEPIVEPVEPIVEPVEPIVEPVEPTEPVVEPVESVVESTEHTEPILDEDGNVTDWDDDLLSVVTPPVEPVEPVIPLINYAEMATDFGIVSETPITTKEQLLAANEARLKKAEEKDFLEGVPTQLREAVELSKKGGDYVGYLSEQEVDYNDFSVDEFLAMGYQNYFKDENGTVKDDELQAYIDNVDPIQKNIEADRVKAALKAKQAIRLSDIHTRAETRKADEARKAREAISGLTSVANLKLGDKHKDQILKVITSGSLNKVLFGEEKGELDYKQVAEVIFNKLYGEKIINVNSQRVRNTTKRGMLDTMSNKNVKGKTSSRPNPTIVKTSAMDSYMNQLTGKG